MVKKLFFRLVFSVSILIVTAPVHAVTISFEPSAAIIQLHDTIEVDIVISDLINEDLAAFDFNVNFNDTILSIDSYMLHDHLGSIPVDAIDLSDMNFSPGVINLQELSLLFDFELLSQPDEFTLARLSFTGIGTGSSDLVISGSSSQFFGATFVESSPLANDIFPNIETGNITVNAPIPEPSTIFLLGIGLLSISGIFRKNLA